MNEPFVMIVQVMVQEREGGTYHAEDDARYSMPVPLVNVGDWIEINDGSYRPVLSREVSHGDQYLHVMYHVDSWREYNDDIPEPPAKWLAQ